MVTRLTFEPETTPFFSPNYWLPLHQAVAVKELNESPLKYESKKNNYKRQEQVLNSSPSEMQGLFQIHSHFQAFRTRYLSHLT
jgi:hypothetical protein